MSHIMGNDSKLDPNLRDDLDTSSVASITSPNNHSIKTKMNGYMDKRSKLLGWRRYWFVLDGRLLTYYKSQAHYERLAVCSGSINLGIVIRVNPIGPPVSRRNSAYTTKEVKGLTFQIVTKTQLYYLRCRDKSELDEWIIAIQHSVSLPPRISSKTYSSTFALDALDDSPTSDSCAQIKNNRYSQHSLHSLASKYKSKPTALSQWSLNYDLDWMDDPNYNYLTSSQYQLNSPQSTNSSSHLPKPTSVLKKYHSLTSLAFPFSSPFSTKSPSNSKSKLKTKTKTTSSTDLTNQSNNNLYTNSPSSQQIQQMKQMREKRDVSQSHKNKNLHNMRHASSLLILNTSPRPELVRKTSTPLTNVMSTATLPNYLRHRSSKDIQTDTDNFNFNHNNKSKKDVPVPTADSGIYEPCGDDPDQGQAQNNQKGHVHVEWQGAVVVKPVNLNGNLRKSSVDNIYESLDDQNDCYDHPNPNAESILADQEQQKQLPNENYKLPTIHQRFSLHPRESIGSTSLRSIDEEIHEQESTPFYSTESNSNSNLNGDNNVFDQSNENGREKISTATLRDAATRRKQFKLTKSNSKIGGFVQTIFSKWSKKKIVDISGPVDLRANPGLRNSTFYHISQEELAQENQEQLEQQQQKPQQQKQSQQEQQILSNQRHPSIEEEEEPKQMKKDATMGFRPAVGVGSDSKSTENLLLELNHKIGQMNMKKSNSCEGNSCGESGNGYTMNDQKRSRILSRKTVSHSDDFKFQNNNSITFSHKDKATLTRNEQNSNSQPDQGQGQGTQTDSSSSHEPNVTHPENLARFSRITCIGSGNIQSSQALAFPTRHPSLPNESLSKMNESSVGRSHSYSCPGSAKKFQKPPLLPPKRKPVPTVPLYDVPKNNSPVSAEQLAEYVNGKMLLVKSISIPLPQNEEQEILRKISATKILLSSKSLLSQTSSQSQSQDDSSSHYQNSYSNNLTCPAGAINGKSTPPKPPPRPAKSNRVSQIGANESAEFNNKLSSESEKSMSSSRKSSLLNDNEIAAVSESDRIIPVPGTVAENGNNTGSLIPQLPRSDGYNEEEIQMRRKSGPIRLHRIQSQTYDESMEENEGRVISAAEAVIDEKWQKPEDPKGLKIVQALPVDSHPLFAQPLKIPNMETIGPKKNNVKTKVEGLSKVPKKGEAEAKANGLSSISKTNDSNGMNNDNDCVNTKVLNVKNSMQPTEELQNGSKLALVSESGSGSGSTSGDSGVCGDGEGINLDLVEIDEEDDGSHFYDDVPLELEHVEKASEDVFGTYCVIGTV